VTLFYLHVREVSHRDKHLFTQQQQAFAELHLLIKVAHVCVAPERYGNSYVTTANKCFNFSNIQNWLLAD
jgi:hypothetical protein